LVKDLASDVVHLPSKENLIWAAVGGGLALAVHPADDNVNHALVNSSFAHDFFGASNLPPAGATQEVTGYLIPTIRDRYQRR